MFEYNFASLHISSLVHRTCFLLWDVMGPTGEETLNWQAFVLGFNINGSTTHDLNLKLRAAFVWPHNHHFRVSLGVLRNPIVTDFYPS